jgi:hypothetical protein
LTTYQIRPDLREAHARAWERLAAPGTWLDGRQRVDIAMEVRAALTCSACEQRKAALSPETPIAAAHASASGLSVEVIDLIHRVATDADRLTQGWFEQVVPAVLSEHAYVETIGVIAEVTAVDRFDAALGQPLCPLPLPIAGQPHQTVTAAAKLAGAWVQTVAPEDLTAADPAAAHAMYENRSAANIHRALSLVPDSVVGFFDLDDAMYLPDAQLRDFEHESRAISHAQIELLAARVSALNRCLY